MSVLRCAAIVASLTVYSGCQSSRLETSRNGTPGYNSNRISELGDGDDFAAKGSEESLAKGWPSGQQSAQASADSGSVAELLEAGHQELRDDRLEQAKRIYRQILDREPNHPVAHHRLAVIADKQRDFPTAEQHYSLALDSDPNNENILNDLGYSYLLQGRYQQSELALTEALRVNPSFARAMKNLGLLYGSMGDYDRALATFRQSGSEQEAQSYIAELFPNGARPVSSPRGPETPVNNQSFGLNQASAYGHPTDQGLSAADPRISMNAAFRTNPSSYPNSAYGGQYSDQQGNYYQAGSTGWPTSHATNTRVPTGSSPQPDYQTGSAASHYAASSTAYDNQAHPMTQTWPGAAPASQAGANPGATSWSQSHTSESQPKAWIADVQPQRPPGIPAASYNPAMTQSGGSPYMSDYHGSPADTAGAAAGQNLADGTLPGTSMPRHSAQVFPRPQTHVGGGHPLAQAQPWPPANSGAAQRYPNDSAAFSRTAGTIQPAWPQTAGGDGQSPIDEAQRMAALVGMEVGAGSPFPIAGDSGAQPGATTAPVETHPAGASAPTTAAYWGYPPGITIQAASRVPGNGASRTSDGDFSQQDSTAYAPNSQRMITPYEQSGRTEGAWPNPQATGEIRQPSVQPSPWPQSPHWNLPAQSPGQSTATGNPGYGPGPTSTWPPSTPPAATATGQIPAYGQPAAARPVQQRPQSAPANPYQWPEGGYQRQQSWPAGG